jgi:hypothetical protein
LPKYAATVKKIRVHLKMKSTSRNRQATAKSALLCLIVICTFLGAKTACARHHEIEGEIQPFGNLRWDDGVVDIVSKVNQFPGLARFAWTWPELLRQPLPVNLLRLPASQSLSAILPLAYQDAEPYTDLQGRKQLVQRNT